MLIGIRYADHCCQDQFVYEVSYEVYELYIEEILAWGVCEAFGAPVA